MATKSGGMCSVLIAIAVGGLLLANSDRVLNSMQSGGVTLASKAMFSTALVNLGSIRPQGSPVVQVQRSPAAVLATIRVTSPVARNASSTLPGVVSDWDSIVAAQVADEAAMREASARSKQDRQNRLNEQATLLDVLVTNSMN